MTIICDAISKSFDGKKILDSFSYHFEQDRYALLGASGKGKTTLLRLLAGLEKPDEGSIKKSTSLQVNYMFQENRLLPWCNVLHNVALFSNKDYASFFLDRLGLADVLNQMPSTLSGGMQRRVALARSLAFGKDVLLLDEPSTGLDQAWKEKVYQLILETFPNQTIVVATHDLKEAKAFCNHSILLE